MSFCPRPTVAPRGEPPSLVTEGRWVGGCLCLFGEGERDGLIARSRLVVPQRAALVFALHRFASALSDSFRHGN